MTITTALSVKLENLVISTEYKARNQVFLQVKRLENLVISTEYKAETELFNDMQVA